MEQQEVQVLSYLKTGKTLTAIQALDMFRCFRLAARIHTLRQKGWPILKDIRVGADNTKVHYAAYYLDADKKKWPNDQDQSSS